MSTMPRVENENENAKFQTSREGASSRRGIEKDKENGIGNDGASAECLRVENST
jgi:hypothetical protein